MNQITISNYNMYPTLMGGQAFCWDFDGKYYTGFTSSRIIKLKYEKDLLFWQTYPKTDDYDYIRKYLRLDVDYADIVRKFPHDRYMNEALKTFRGTRLLAQDFQDTLLGYLCSSNKSIKGIRLCVRNMRDRFGEETEADGVKHKLFPKMERIANSSVEELTECKVGFRAKYILDAAKRYARGEFSGIEHMDYESAKQLLVSNIGIGDKIADCVLLYSLKHDDIIPLDVWVKRVLYKYYGLDSKMKYDDIRKWIREYFNGAGGWAGQILFEYIRGFKIEDDINETEELT